jgi:dihydroorotase
MAFSILNTYLIKTGRVKLETVIDALTVNPGRRFGIDCGIRIGDRANLAIIDVEAKVVYDEDNFKSKGKNYPFRNMKMDGKVVGTVVKGDL